MVHDAPPARQRFSPFMAFIAQLHAYIGLFVGPFLLISALTGVLYVLTPQLENHIYRQQLETQTTGPAKSLQQQIGAAQAYLSEHGQPAPALFAVRPAPREGMTSRIMFAMPEGRSGESLAVFVDPVSLNVHGALVAYGTSGTLPFRGALDYFHRDLGLGDVGRYYSETAASWLWVGVISGFGLWLYQRLRRRAVAGSQPRPSTPAQRWHRRVGLVIAIGVLFFSATGMTWSYWAGETRLEDLRKDLGWVTPSLATELAPDAASASGGHEGHEGHEGHGGHGAAAADDDGAGLYDPVLKAAREAGIDAGDLEIRPPKKEGHAWTVREIYRGWPSQVDSVAVDHRSMQVISRADFENFPLIAKLIRWGIDAHMGILFGVANQLLVAALAIALMGIIVLGYMMWWRRTRQRAASASHTLTGAWLQMRLPGQVFTVAFFAFFGWWLPVLGVSLLLFLAIDLLRYFRLRQVF